MHTHGFVRGLSAVRVSPAVSGTFKSKLRSTSSLIALAAAASLFGGGAFAQGLTIEAGETHDVVGPQVYDFLEMEPGSTLNFGSLITNDLQVNDNGVNTTWSGTINSSAVPADKDDQYLIKAGDGTVTLQDLYANGTEIHLSNGTAQQTSGTNTLYILNVGSNIPAAGTATLNISGGTLNIGPAGLSSPIPRCRWGISAEPASSTDRRHRQFRQRLVTQHRQPGRHRHLQHQRRHARLCGWVLRTWTFDKRWRTRSTTDE